MRDDVRERRSQDCFRIIAVLERPLDVVVGRGWAGDWFALDSRTLAGWCETTRRGRQWWQELEQRETDERRRRQYGKVC